jgi:hydroxyethylthiazole kinase-like uncharacterized protein yjeF
MTILQNNPLLWRDKLPVHDPQGHKYARGISIIYGAPKMTGATRLAARAAARMGAGLVKVIAPQGTGNIYRTTLHEEIIVEDEADFKGFDDPRIKALLIGPGTQKSDVDTRLIEGALKAGACGIVLDAGAFAAWERKGDPARVVVTPHEGEFAARFGRVETVSKVDQARKASEEIEATVVLKGAQTVVAGLGDVIVQDRNVPQLATAGTGDVLAGMICGLIAQGMEAKWAAAAAVWIHAEAAERFGKGLVSSDLPDIIPSVLQGL